MGILILAVAVLPFLGTAGYQFIGSETRPLDQRHLSQRIRETTRTLAPIYLLFTALLATLLVVGGMSLLDACCYALGTVSTGGFSTQQTSIAAYDSLYIEAVIWVFMLLCSLPFGLHALALRSPRRYLQSPQLQLHLSILAVAGTAVVLQFWSQNGGEGLTDFLRSGIFQMTSIITTTGFSTAESAHWPPFGRGVLILLMLIGGCTGSTSGGIKTFRLLVLGKQVRRQLSATAADTDASGPIQTGTQQIDESVLRTAGVFVVAFILTALLGALALILLGIGGETAVIAAPACLAGVGQALGLIDSGGDYASMNEGAKLVCMALMLLGRLEIFTFAVVFVPAFWGSFDS